MDFDILVYRESSCSKPYDCYLNFSVVKIKCVVSATHAANILPMAVISWRARKNLSMTTVLTMIIASLSIIKT